MSKSFGNCIFLNDSPKDVFGKAMSISDDMMHEWQPIFFDEFDVAKHPMQQKKELAHQITKEIWGEEEANNALLGFESTIQNRELPDNMPEIPVGNILDVVKEIINGSKSEARRLLIANAVKINGERATETFLLKEGDIVKVGKLKYAKLI
jgi:tyrosyl-tRNA synthetase